MIIFRVILATVLLSISTCLFAADDLMDVGRAVSIDVMLENAIRRGLISGGIVAIGNHSGQLYGTS